MDFVAIDFETANEKRSSPCAVGLAVVKNGIIANRFAWLIRPPEFRFSRRNVAIHGITPEDVKNEPEFPEVWQAIRPYIEKRTLVAHSAAFDVAVLMRTLRFYHIPEPEFRYLCTVRVAKAVWPAIGSYTLRSVATMLGISFDHHDAAEDAFACAEIARCACKQTESRSIDQLAERLGITFGKRVAWHKKRKAPEFSPSTGDLDPTHPLFGRVVVFTGPLTSMERSDAMQHVSDVGGQPARSVTKKTDFVVVGGSYFDVYSQKTTKLQKAVEMASKGIAIDIIGEDDFLKLLAD